MHIVLMGIQGSGKGTQASKIIEKYGYITFETGALIRKQIKENPEGEVAQTVHAGNLVNDEMIADMTADFFSENPEQRVLIDGAIRTVNQKENFNKITTNYVVIFLDLSEQEALKRLGGRRMDPETGEIFGADHAEDVNPKTGNTLITRKDDTPEGISKRLQEFREKTAPLIEGWRDDEVDFYHIDASGSRDQVWDQIDTVIEEVLEK